MSLKSFKTPLRYPGGKSRACKKMEPFFPDLRDYEVYYEPFLGGGSVALHITKKYPKLKIVVNDLYEPLYNFWLQLQVKGDYIHSELQQLKSNFLIVVLREDCLKMQKKNYMTLILRIKTVLFVFTL